MQGQILIDKYADIQQQPDNNNVKQSQSWQDMIMMGNPLNNKIIVKSKLQMKISFCNFFEIQQRDTGEEEGSIM